MNLEADEFEAERRNLLDKVDTCAAHKAEQHKLEWESKRRAEEVKELQKVLLPLTWHAQAAALPKILCYADAASQWHTVASATCRL